MEVDRHKKRRYFAREETHDTKDELIETIQLDEIIEEFFLRTRRVLVVGEINEVSSTYICSNLQLLSLKSDPIYMYINSPGGCLASGYAIIDQMLMCKCPVYTIVRGQGYSMGALIAAFGTKGCRYATPNSSMMLHSIVIQSPSVALEQHSEMTQYVQDDYMRKIAALSKRMKLNKQQLVKLMEKTRWMSPKNAMKIGLIDGVWTQSKELSVNKRCLK